MGIRCGMALNKATVTKWCCPVRGRFKFNADGCSKGNPGHSEGGSILRNAEGKVIWAQADYYGIQINTVAEAKALWQGLNRCWIDAEVLCHSC